jgi:hypothetical protein
LINFVNYLIIAIASKAARRRVCEHGKRCSVRVCGALDRTSNFVLFGKNIMLLPRLYFDPAQDTAVEVYLVPPGSSTTST